MVGIFPIFTSKKFAKIHPETAIAESVKKFEQRFRYMEKAALDKGERIENIDREEMERLWDEAKESNQYLI